MDTFSKYQPLFMEAINNNRIGVCKWIESGTTIDTALPELGEMTNDKEEWRAIIVRFEDEQLMSVFESDKRNPFDFVINKTCTEGINESEIPLIRLTQMLGGVPKPEVKFETEETLEGDKSKGVSYRPVKNMEEEEAYDKLCQKYEYDGKLPSSIVIISIRNGYVEKNEIEMAWSSRRESNSSEFWKRNRYPSQCRFLVYDFEKQGPVQRNADEFGFWFSILLLSINQIDSSTLQAYRLYKLKTIFDKELMRETFQTTVNRLCSARLGIENEIKRDIEHQVIIADRLPAYKMEIPVAINMQGDCTTTVSMKDFGLFGEGANTDIAKWSQSKKDVEENLACAIRVAERALEQTADRMKMLCSFSEEEVLGLDKYQIEDLTRETNEIYSEIVEIQGKLPTDNIATNPAIKEATKDIKRYLSGRVKSETAFSLLGFVILLIILCNIPAMINYFANGIGSMQHIFFAICIEIVTIIGCSFAVLLLQKGELDGLIHIYNSKIKSAYNNILENTSEYSRYLSRIASHQRGHSYLALSKRKKYKVNVTHYSKYKHIKAIDIFLSKIKAWSAAYHIQTDFDTPDMEENTTVNDYTAPANNSMYTFETENIYPIPVNKSGTTVDSPFCFAKKLEITREEVYDDDY